MKRFCKTAVLTLLLSCVFCLSAQAMENDMLKVGIKYGNDALSAANLQNYSAFGGYAFGYYDSSRSFTELGRVGASYEKVTVTTDTTYAIELDAIYPDYDSARSAASAYGGYPAYTLDGYRVRIGTYPTADAASAASSDYPGASRVTGASPTGVKIFITDTNTVLFGFDCSGLMSLGIRPIEAGGKTVTWFKGYRYYGGFEYQRVTGGNISVINVVGLEDYVKCVIPWEMSNDWPLEALKAQSVCARTYAACQTRHKSRGFDVCTTTDCQVYQGTAACSAHSDRAVEETAGEYLWYDGAIVREAVYYSSNGGASEDAKNVWGTDVGYLKGKTDPYEGRIASRIAKYNWSTTYSSAELTTLLKNKGYNIGTVQKLYVSKYTDTGNVLEITFVGTNGTKTFQRENCRLVLGLRSMRFTINGGGADTAGGGVYVNNSSQTATLSGAYVISGSGTKSAYSGGETYVITSSGKQLLEQQPAQGAPAASDSFTITGSGSGHNVGLSQWGAYAMADLGYTYEDILQFYYTGVTIR